MSLPPPQAPSGGRSERQLARPLRFTNTAMLPSQPKSNGLCEQVIFLTAARKLGLD